MQRGTVHPQAFRTLLGQLGIDPDKEADVHEQGPVEGGMCPYGGWFYLVGKLVEKGERLAEVAKDFDCFFRGGGVLAGSKGWFGKPVLALEFMTRIGWLSPGDPAG